MCEGTSSNAGPMWPASIRHTARLGSGLCPALLLIPYTDEVGSQPARSVVVWTGDPGQPLGGRSAGPRTPKSITAAALGDKPCARSLKGAQPDRGSRAQPPRPPRTHVTRLSISWAGAGAHRTAVKARNAPAGFLALPHGLPLRLPI